MPLAQPKVTLPIDLDNVIRIEQQSIAFPALGDLAVYVVQPTSDRVTALTFHAQVTTVAIVPVIGSNQ